MPETEFDHRGHPTAPRPVRFPFCGILSLTTPFLGYIALEIFLPCFDDGRQWDWRLFWDGGPTWLRDVGYCILGTAGLIGFVSACIACWRGENRVIAVLGMLINAPWILVLITGVIELIPQLPDLLDPRNREPKGNPIRG